MYSETTKSVFDAVLAEFSGRDEVLLSGPQGSNVQVGGRQMINLCSNNYLGLAADPRLGQAAREALDEFGVGMASVRFICGTQSAHQDLERILADWLGTDDAILYSSCFDANVGLFEALLTDQDAIISDSLNHASLIDGIRLCKASRYRYPNCDLNALEDCLKKARETARVMLIVTDGVFSMDGTYADVAGICNLAEEYGALVFVDDSHAIGFVGETGAGTPERDGCKARVDLVSGTFGKALGGASGGYVAGRQPLIDVLRRRSRPYLFSNSLAPVLVAVAREAIHIARTEGTRRKRLWELTDIWRNLLTSKGFSVATEAHPINPIILGDASKTAATADRLFQHGIHTAPFAFPVVPRGVARIRTQISADHTEEQLNTVLTALVDSRSED